MNEISLRKIERLLNLMDEDALTRKDFNSYFEKVVNLVLKMKEEQKAVIAGLEKVFDLAIDKIKTEHNGFVSDVGTRTKEFDFNVKRKIEELIKAKEDLLESKEEMVNFVSDKINEMEHKVSLLKPEKGEKGESGNVITENDILSAIEKSDSIKKFKEDWDNKVQQALVARGGRTGFGGGSQILHSLRDISTDTSPLITGSVNGANTIFYLPKTPRKNGLSLYHNGVRQHEGTSNDYTLSGNKITFNTAPITGDRLVADIDY
jgi:hypothetical protein